MWFQERTYTQSTFLSLYICMLSSSILFDFKLYVKSQQITIELLSVLLFAEEANIHIRYTQKSRWMLLDSDIKWSVAATACPYFSSGRLCSGTRWFDEANASSPFIYMYIYIVYVMLYDTHSTPDHRMMFALKCRRCSTFCHQIWWLAARSTAKQNLWFAQFECD